MCIFVSRAEDLPGLLTAKEGVLCLDLVDALAAQSDVEHLNLAEIDLALGEEIRQFQLSKGECQARMMLVLTL